MGVYHHIKSFLKVFLRGSTEKFALVVMVGMVLIALLAGILASPLPFYVKIEGERYYPFFYPNQRAQIQEGQTNRKQLLRLVDWHQVNSEACIWPLVSYGPHYIDKVNRTVGPFEGQYKMVSNGARIPLQWRHRHWMGTDKGGKDMLAMLLHGTRTSLLVGLLGMGIAGLLGLLLGSLAGYFGNDRMKLSKGICVGVGLVLIPMWFYAWYCRRFLMVEAASGQESPWGIWLISLIIAILIFLMGIGLGKLLQHTSWGRQEWRIPVDRFVLQLMAFLSAVPNFLILMAVVVMFRKNIFALALAIGLLSWIVVARLVRGDMLKVAGLPYIQAARLQGFHEFYIWFKHALPNALTSFWIIFAFGVGDVIVAEASLAFIGLDTTESMVSWGKLLARRGGIVDKWWLVLGPGFAIFLVVFSCNILGERLRDMLDSKFESPTNSS